MANRSSGAFKTPEQPSRTKSRLPEASPNFTNFMHQLPDLTPPRKQYSEGFASLNPGGASPQQVGFGFARLPASSPERLRNSDNKAAGNGYDGGELNLLGLRGTPMKSTITTELSPRTFSLQAPPMPIFHPSPRRSTHPTDSYLQSPEAPRRGRTTPSHENFGFSLSPRGIASPNMGQMTSNFAAILDGHSRVSPLNIKAVLAGASAIAMGGNPPPGANGHPMNGSNNPNPNECGSGGGTPRALPDTSNIVVKKEKEGDLGVASARPFAGLFASAPTVTDGGKPGSSMMREINPLMLDVTMSVPPIMEEGEEDDEDMFVNEEERTDALHDDDDDHNQHSNQNIRGSQRHNGAVVYRGQELGTESIVGGTAGGHIGNGSPLMNGMGGMNGYVPRRRPERRRALDFSSPVRSSGRKGGKRGDDEESGQLVGDTAPPMLHAMLPSSPIVQPVSMSMDTLLPIARLRDEEGLDLDAVHRSPIQRPRMGTIDINSPAVKEAANAAVAAALQANRSLRERGNASPPALSRRAAAAAAAAREAAMGSVGMTRGSGGGSGGESIGLRERGVAEDTSGMLSAGLPAAPSGQVKCNCKKSRCLKLYCDCFKIGIFCAPSCSCVSCANRADNTAVVNDAREQIVSRNPLAFSQKIVEADTSQFGAQHRRGCNCKKSKCLKKYCECFQAGIACGELCKCEACHNTVDAQVDRPQAPPSLIKRPRLEEGPGLGPGQVPVSALQPSLSMGGTDLTPGKKVDNGIGGGGPAGNAAAMPALQLLLLQQMKQRAVAAQQAQQHPAHGTPPAANGTTTQYQQQQHQAASITTCDGQVLVPISWPLTTAPNGVGGGQHPPTLVALSPTSAAAVAAATNGSAAGNNQHPGPAASLVTAFGATTQQQQQQQQPQAQVLPGGSLALTPVCGPGLGEESPSPAAVLGANQSQDTFLTTSTQGVGSQQAQQGRGGSAGCSSGDHSSGSLDDGALEGSSERKESRTTRMSGRSMRSTRGGIPLAPPLPLPSNITAAVANNGTSGGENGGRKPTPTKRKPARTMTAALE